MTLRSSQTGCTDTGSGHLASERGDALENARADAICVTASMRFLPRDPLWDEEKPYHIRYYPHGDVPRTNVTPVTVHNVAVRNIRPDILNLKLDEDGVVVRRMDTKMNYEQFGDPEAVTQIYLSEVCSFLKELLGTNNVSALEYLIRRRHSSFPLSLETEFDYVQPVATAHVDFSPDCIREILEDRYGSSVSDITTHRYQLITVWKPLRGPLQDWPLSICHPKSIDAADMIPMDRVYPNHVEESISIQYSPKQDWLFLKDQMPNELLIFRGGDSEVGIKGGLAHCAFQLPDAPEGTFERESIEARFIVSYTEADVDLARKRPSARYGPCSSK